MPRSKNVEWVGKNDDAMPPDGVRRSICERQNWICACGCTRVMDPNVDRIDIDHIVPLIDRGENRERNLQALLHEHHVEKTKVENSQRAEGRRHQAKAFVKPQKSRWASRPLGTGNHQHTATKPLTKTVRQFARVHGDRTE